MIVLFQITGLNQLVDIVVGRVTPDCDTPSIRTSLAARTVVNNIVQLYMRDLDPDLEEDKEILEDDVALDIIDNLLTDDHECVSSMRYILSLIPKTKIHIAKIINDNGDLLLVITPPR